MPTLTTTIQSLISRTLERSVILKIPMYGYDTTNLNYRLANRDLSPELKNVISKLSRDSSIKSVLDLGSGDGVFEFNSHKRTYSYTSIDIEEAAIRTLQKAFEKQPGTTKDKAIVGDITQLASVSELQNKHFDAAILWRVLHGIPPQHHTQIFRNIHHLLAPNSSLYIAVASDQDWKATALGNKDQQMSMSDCADIMFRQHGIKRDTPFNVHFFSQNKLAELGANTGFRLNEMTIFQEPSGYSHLQDKNNTYIFAHFTKD